MTKIGIVPVTIPRGAFVDVPQLRRVLRNVAEGMAKDILIDFKVTTQTWNTTPEFSITRQGNKFFFGRIIGTDSDIYKFVTKGTRVRYATMTPDFVPKTRVKVIGSRRGKGGLARVNRQKPKPGIKARDFDKEIALKWQKLAPQIVERAIAAEVT